MTMISISSLRRAEADDMRESENEYQRQLSEAELIAAAQASILEDCERGHDLGWLEWIDEPSELVCALAAIVFGKEQPVEQVALAKERILHEMRSYAQHEAETRREWL